MFKFHEALKHMEGINKCKAYSKNYSLYCTLVIFFQHWLIFGFEFKCLRIHSFILYIPYGLTI